MDVIASRALDFRGEAISGRQERIASDKEQERPRNDMSFLRKVSYSIVGMFTKYRMYVSSAIKPESQFSATNLVIYATGSNFTFPLVKSPLCIFIETQFCRS
jgi:hypothetical protein